MNDLSKFVKDNAEVIKAEMVCRVWLLVEAIHYHPKNSKESAKITRPAHLWLLDGLSYLTLEDLNYLYSLLVHTKRTKLTSSKDTRISQLLSKLYDINTDHFSGTSQYQNFKRRGAVHFHALFWGLPETTVETERYTRLVAGMWGHGFVYVKMTDGNEKLSSYLAKYMAKSFIDYRLKNQKAYTCSRNLLRPQIVGGISSYSIDCYLQECGVKKPEVDKSYDTHWLGRARHRIYQLE